MSIGVLLDLAMRWHRQEPHCLKIEAVLLVMAAEVVKLDKTGVLVEAPQGLGFTSTLRNLPF